MFVIAIMRRLGMNRQGRLGAPIRAVLRRPKMRHVRRTVMVAIRAPKVAIGGLTALGGWLLTILASFTQAPVALLALEVKRNRQLRTIARGAWKIGPLIIGRPADIDAFSRGESIISVTHGRSGRKRSIVRCGPIAILHVGDFKSLIEPLLAFDAEIAESRVARARAHHAPADSGRSNRRSVLFLHQCYYNFLYLAEALRRRGWDAVCASIEDPNVGQAQFYHGDDVNLFDPEPEQYRRNLVEFFAEVESRFRMLHFYGRGIMSMFPAYFDRQVTYDRLPVDFLRLRQRGIKIGYTVVGCSDGVAQSSINKWSGACNRCVWQDQPEICSDASNLAWGHKVHTMCDVVDTGGAASLDWKGNAETVFRDALTMALDPEVWRPDLEIPEKYRLQRSPGELIIYHAVGNYKLRSRNGRNIKGTDAIVDAIERLKSEGFPVRLEFVTNVPSQDVRFIQVQADIMVDQLNYGRYGAQACEGMMLGRPVICYLNKDELPGISTIPFVEECPIVSATEASIYDVLKELLSDENRRRELAKASRDFAVKWHSADACAERFEMVYDRVMQGLPPSNIPFGQVMH
ncbi:glycosyltransferase [Bradyrhizobium sp. USDA 4452]